MTGTESADLVFSTHGSVSEDHADLHTHPPIHGMK